MFLRTGKDKEAMEDYQKALELFFAYGYGCCVSKHAICGDQPKVPDSMPDSSNFLPPKCLVSPSCLLVPVLFEDATAGVHCREVAEELERGPPRWGFKWNVLSSTFSSTFSYFCNGPSVAAWIYIIM